MNLDDHNARDAFRIADAFTTIVVLADIAKPDALRAVAAHIERMRDREFDAANLIDAMVAHLRRTAEERTS